MSKVPLQNQMMNSKVLPYVSVTYFSYGEISRLWSSIHNEPFKNKRQHTQFSKVNAVFFSHFKSDGIVMVELKYGIRHVENHFSDANSFNTAQRSTFSMFVGSNNLAIANM